MPIKEQLILEGKDQTRGAFNSVQKSLGNLNKNTTLINRNLGGLTRTLGTVATAFAGAFTVKSIIDVTARFEDLRTTLTSVTGSAESGAEAFEFISEFATKTQFGVEELTQTYIKLASNGIDPSVELLTKFTDAAAVTTDQIGSLQSLTDFYTRSLQAQTVELTDLNRLSDRGLPVYDIIKEKLGVTRGEISKFSKEIGGTVKIVEALGDGISERFGGATQARVNNLSTRISNFQIALTNAADTLGQGFNQALGETIVSITELIENNDELIQQIGVDLGEGIKRASEFAKELKEPIQDIGAVLGTMIDGFESLPSEVKTIGLVGAILFGKKGAAALAGISYVFGKIKEEVDEFNQTLETASKAAEGDVQARISMIDDEITRLYGDLAKAQGAAQDFSLNLDQQGDFVPLEIGPGDDVAMIMQMINDLQKEKAELMAIANKEQEKSNAITQQSTAYGDAYNNSQKKLNETIKDNKEKVEETTATVQQLLDPYKEWINLGEKYAKQTGLDPQIEKYLEAGEAINKLKEAQDKIRDINTDKGVEAFLKLQTQINAATAAQKAFGQAVVDDVARSLQTQVEIVEEAYQDQVYKIEFALKNQLITKERYDDLITRAEKAKQDELDRITKEGEATRLKIKEDALREELKMRGVNSADIEKRLELEQASRFEQGQAVLDNTVKIFQALGQENKKAFQAYKAFAIAQAIIDSISAAQSAFKAMIGIPVVGPVLAYTAAGAALAAGYARVNAIRSQTYGGRREGGPVTGGSPFLVGEDQPEVFTPRTNGEITPLDKLMDRQQQPVQVVFQIQANDTRGFDDLIKQRRGLIVNMINDAVMNKGKEALI